MYSGRQKREWSPDESKTDYNSKKRYEPKTKVLF